MSGELKLWVVGETSGDPADWGEWTSRMLVLASNEDHAIEVSGDYAGVAAEVEFNNASRLMTRTVRH